jgi:hypothetical protein
MIRKQEFFNAECDHCGAMLCEENWWDKEVIEDLMKDCGWKTLEGRHYCENCWEFDDDGNIITKDGKKWILP